MSWRWTIAIAAAMVAAACTDSDPISPPDLSVHTVEVSPAGPFELVAGDTVRLIVYPKTADGTILGGIPVEWSTDSAQVAELELSLGGYHALVRALAPGTTQLHATAAGRTGSVTVSVAMAPVASVTVSPELVELEIGGETVLDVVLRGADETVLEGRVVTWSSGADSVASVDGAGRVTARAPGTAAIRAESEGVWGEALVVVRAPEEPPPPVDFVQVRPSLVRAWIGNVHSLRATPYDAAGRPLEDRAVAWSVQDAGVATVDSAGVVRALGAGVTSVFATSQGVTGSATFKSYAHPTDHMALVFFGTVSDTSSALQLGIDTTWVDEHAVEHPAFMFVKEGRLSMHWGATSSYEQVLVFETFITENQHAKLVAETEYVDRGTLQVFYDLYTGERIFEFDSSMVDGLSYSARFSLPGELEVLQPVWSTPVLPYYFDLR